MRAPRALLISAVVLLVTGSLWQVTSIRSAGDVGVGTRLSHGGLEDLPISFEANEGQFAPDVEYLARGGDGVLSLTGNGPVFSLRTSAPSPGAGPAPPSTDVRMDLVGASHGRLVPAQELPGVVNYFRGSDPSEWHTAIPTYRAVRYREVYPGIDLLFSGTGGELEYDFVVAPQADPASISIRFEGADAVRLGPEGELLISTPAGELTHSAPVIYQPGRDDGADRVRVDGGYRLLDERVSFHVDAYDHSLPLVIDPVVLGFSTLIGGSGSETGHAIAFDASGATYVTGEVDSTDFPTTPGAHDTAHNGDNDVFVTKLSPSGDALLYSTYLGGESDDRGKGIAVDGSGAAYVTGITNDESVSTGYPTTPGAYDTTSNGYYDAFVTKLTSAGSLVYSTFLGGSGFDDGRDIAVDGAGVAYVAGATGDDTTDYPTTPATTHNGGDDVFVTKVASSGASLLYSTLIGGTADDRARGLAIDASGSAFITGLTQDGATDYPTTPGAFDGVHNGGFDAFVTKLGASGGTLDYSTLLGGSGTDLGLGLAIDGAGAAYVVGDTVDDAIDYPTTPGAVDGTPNGGFDAFVTKLGVSGNALAFSTILGGTLEDEGLAIAVDAAGASYVTGFTEDGTTDYPTTPSAYDTTHNGFYDAFVTKLAAGGALIYSTFLGGSDYDAGEGIAVDGAGTAFVTGQTVDDAIDFPTTPGTLSATHNGDRDVFVTTLFEPTCRGRLATAAGTYAGETVVGTPGADVIAGLGGNDAIKGLGGKDLICGGDGNDKLNGGGGKDTLLGEAGKDKLKGGGANDKLKGGPGKDTCAGGGGKDKAGCERETKVP
jgi:hypothetical protein